MLLFFQTGAPCSQCHNHHFAASQLPTGQILSIPSHHVFFDYCNEGAHSTQKQNCCDMFFVANMTLSRYFFIGQEESLSVSHQREPHVIHMNAIIHILEFCCGIWIDHRQSIHNHEYLFCSVRKDFSKE